MDFERALSIVYSALEAVNDLRPADAAIPQDPEVVLAGDGGALDSLALTTLVLSIENRVEEVTGLEVALIRDGDFEAQLAALRTPTTLASLLVAQVQS